MNLTKNCFPGEVFKEKLGQCVMCQEGTYSFNPKEKSCNLCPKEASQCLKNSVFLSVGFWRSSSLSNIYLCFPNSKSCL